MKVAKNIGDPIYTNRIQIVANYFLVDDDYDFVDNNRVDVTSVTTLRAFYGVGRMDLRRYRLSLKNNILPDFMSLTFNEKKELLLLRIIPENFTDIDIINIVGEDGLLYIERNISDDERIEDLETNKLGIDDVDDELVIGGTNPVQGGVLYEAINNAIEFEEDEQDPEVIQPRFGKKIDANKSLKNYYLVYSISNVTEVTIGHTLNRRPIVQIIDSDKAVVNARIEHIDDNSTKITFLGTFTGTVIFT